MTKKSMLTFLHTADTHVGHSGNASLHNEYRSLQIDKKTDYGVNVRTDDINRSFSQTVDHAIEQKVDVILHAGDGFDKWGYKQPFIFDYYASEVKRATDAGIVWIQIAGNHDFAKQAGKGNYLSTLSNLIDNCYTVYRGIYEPIHLEEFNTTIHCVPSTFNQEFFNAELDKVERIDGHYNILMTHCGVTTIKAYAEYSENSIVVTLDKLMKLNMDYVALGDYHAETDFGQNVHFSGSIERLGYGEINNKPSVKLNKVYCYGTTYSTETSKLFLKVRPMIDVEELDAKNMGLTEINQGIINRLSSCDLTDKIVRFRVRHLPKHLKRQIDKTTIHEMTEKALHFKLEFPDKTESSFDISTGHEVHFEGIREGFTSFVERLSSEDKSFPKDKLHQRGDKLLSEVMENEDY